MPDALGARRAAAGRATGRLMGHLLALAATGALTAAIFLLPAPAMPKPAENPYRLHAERVLPVPQAHAFTIVARASPSVSTPLR